MRGRRLWFVCEVRYSRLFAPALGLLLLGLLAPPTGAQPAGYTREQECIYWPAMLQPGSGQHCCNDGQDNDGDGAADAADASCSHEYLCQDGYDNDGDGNTDAADSDCQCLTDITGITGGCTANDTKIVLVGLGNQEDGCYATGDTQTIYLTAKITTTATTRYDLGMWIALDGGDARTGQCSRQILRPVTTLYGPYQPSTGYGLFANEDGDSCGEAKSVDPETQYSFTFPITTPCVPTTNGFLALPRCASWDNNANTTCDGFWQAVPGTRSKCNCEETVSNIPVPELSLGCSTNLSTVRPGWSVDYTITYDNTCGPCTDDSPPPAEAVRCCTAGYVRFPFSYEWGTISGISASDGGTVSNTYDSGTHQGTLTWYPDSALGTDGIIGPQRSATLTFTFTVDASAPTGTLANEVVTEWSDDAAFSVTSTQALRSGTACNLTVNPTYATVGTVTTSRDADAVVVEWETSGEVGTVGYNVYRVDPTTGAQTKVNRRLLPAVAGQPGGVYRFRDAGGGGSDTATYVIGEVEWRGGETRHGPFETQVTSRGGVRAAVRDFEAVPRRPNRVVPPQARALGRGAAPKASQPAVEAAQIAVIEPGLYQVSAASLAAALGRQTKLIENKIRQGQVQLTHRGLPVAWTPAAGNQGLLFVAEGSGGQYSSEDVYVATLDRGVVMSAGGGFAPSQSPAAGAYFSDTLHVEHDLLPRAYLATGPEDDYWFWEFVVSGSSSWGTRQLRLELPDVADVDEDAEITVHLRGVAMAAPDETFRAAASLNGVRIGSLVWSGPADRAVSLAVGRDTLVSGLNTLQLVGEAGVFMIDAVDVRYPRSFRAAGDGLRLHGDGNAVVEVSGFSSGDVVVLDLTVPGAPGLVTATAVSPAGDGSFAVRFAPAAPDTPYLAVAGGAALTPAAVRADIPSDLRNDRNRGDYVIVTSAALREAAGELAAYRTGAVKAPMVVDLQDVYDEFSFSIPDPAAIRAFVAYAAESWATPPRYLVLAGAGSLDYRDVLGYGGNVVPPIMTLTAYGLYPADNLYGDTDGDGAPEIAVGRIPAATAAELSAYVAKLRDYELAGSGWAGKALLVADNTDHAGDFPRDAETLAPLLGGALDLERIYLGQPFGAGEAHQAILDGLAGGVSLLTYVGHGGMDRLASEAILASADVPALANAPRLPVMAGFTCLVNEFSFPGYITVGEELVLAPSGGVIASWAPSGLAINEASVGLARVWLTEMFANGGSGGPLGDAIVQALRLYLGSGGDRELAVLYGLLGDPFLTLKE